MKCARDLVCTARCGVVCSRSQHAAPAYVSSLVPRLTHSPAFHCAAPWHFLDFREEVFITTRVFQLRDCIVERHGGAVHRSDVTMYLNAAEDACRLDDELKMLGGDTNLPWDTSRGPKPGPGRFKCLDPPVLGFRDCTDRP
jgi:hypothetical protein